MPASPAAPKIHTEAPLGLQGWDVSICRARPSGMEDSERSHASTSTRKRIRSNESSVSFCKLVLLFQAGAILASWKTALIVKMNFPLNFMLAWKQLKAWPSKMIFSDCGTQGWHRPAKMTHWSTHGPAGLHFFAHLLESTRWTLCDEMCIEKSSPFLGVMGIPQSYKEATVSCAMLGKGPSAGRKKIESRRARAPLC